MAEVKKRIVMRKGQLEVVEVPVAPTDEPIALVNIRAGIADLETRRKYAAWLRGIAKDITAQSYQPTGDTLRAEYEEDSNEPS